MKLILKEKTSLKDLVYILIYWRVIYIRLKGNKLGITPGFDGFNWLKTQSKNMFNFLKVKTQEENQKNKPGVATRVRVEDSGKEGMVLGDDDFPELNIGDAKGMKTIQEQMRNHHRNFKKDKGGVTITKKKKKKKGNPLHDSLARGGVIGGQNLHQPQVLTNKNNKPKPSGKFICFIVTRTQRLSKSR